MWTGMLRRCLVAGESRRKPISRLYSTMYSSSGHTILLSFSNSDTCHALTVRTV